MRAILLSTMLVVAACGSDARPAPQSPQPQTGSASQPVDVAGQPKKVTVHDLVQPVKIQKQDETGEGEENGEEGGEEGGVEGGVEGGEEGGVVGGVMGAPPPPPPPPPPPAPPQIVPPKLLEGFRLAGAPQIYPSDADRLAMQNAGKDKVIGSYKLCVDVTGAVASVNQLKSTGFTGYDQKIISTIRTTWRYKPYQVNGKSVPVCTAVTFIFTVGGAPPPAEKP